MVVLLDEVNAEAAANSKKLSADRPVKFATYAKDIQKPGVFLKLLGFNPEVLLRNQVFAERQ